MRRIAISPLNLSLTIFIPAYNEEQNLPYAVEVMIRKATELGVMAEVLIVDDGSRDQTGSIADQFALANKSVRVVHHETNRGIGAAFVTATKAAKNDWLILIPADLALEPDELSRYLVDCDHVDIVVGLRSDRSDYTFFRRVVSYTNIGLIRLLFGMREHQFQYISMYRMAIFREIEIEYWKSAFFLAEILIKAKALGKKLVEVEIQYAPRVAGTATGAKFRLVILTLIDLLHFWLRWLLLGPVKASQSLRGDYGKVQR